MVGLLDCRRLTLGRRAPLEPVLLRSRRRLLPLLASLVRRGRTARVRLPFPLPPEAPATLEVKAKEPGKNRPDGTTLPVRVGDCLAPHWRRWLAIGAESWVVTVLRDGYRVPLLDSPPPLSHTPVSFLTYRAGSPRVQALRQEVEAMLAKRSLRNHPRSGSRQLQSPFSGGEGLWRLETRDRSLASERVRPADSVQDGNSRFCAVICQRGGFSSFLGSEGCVLSDPNPSILEEAIEVHVGGDGLPVPSPVFRTVDRSPGLHQGLCGRVSVGTLSRIRLLRYLDDWLVLSFSERKAKQAIQSLLSLCHTLGIVINEKKSDLVPSQTTKYLGMTNDTEAGKVFPSLAQLEKFLTVAESFCTMDAPPAQLWQVILGHLASPEWLVPHCRLRMRTLQ